MGFDSAGGATEAAFSVRTQGWSFASQKSGLTGTKGTRVPGEAAADA